MNTFRFNVGDIACMVIHEGLSTTPIERLAQKLPAATMDDLLAGLQHFNLSTDTDYNYINLLFIETNGVKMLVDTGMGADTAPTFGNLIPALVSEGIQPGDVDIVFITHFHGDHINGLLDADGKAAFPNARHVAPKPEWDYWMNPETEAQIGSERIQGIKAKLLPLKDKFTFVNDGDEIAPGVTAVLQPGHTPGHTGVLVESNGEKLLNLADSMNREVQLINPDWSIIFDSDPVQSAKTRHTLLKRLVDENLLAFFYHLPFPGVGHVVSEGDHYGWQPLN